MPLVWVAVGVVAGVGITAVGPGGVLVTIALHALSELSPAQVAGTAIVTHVGTGLLGSAVYWRSGQLRQGSARHMAAVLAAAALVGTPAGVAVNGLLSPRGFSTLLGLFVAAVALLLWRRQRRADAGAGEPEPTEPSTAALAAIGALVALVGGAVGVGGPLLTVPVLVALGVGVLPVLAASQVQALVISAVGSAGYLAQGAIDWPLALWLGLPQLVGVVIGWRLAHAVPARQLRYALALALLALAPYLVLRG